MRGALRVKKAPHVVSAADAGTGHRDLAGLQDLQTQSLLLAEWKEAHLLCHEFENWSSCPKPEGRGVF